MESNDILNKIPINTTVSNTNMASSADPLSGYLQSTMKIVNQHVTCERQFISVVSAVALTFFIRFTVLYHISIIFRCTVMSFCVRYQNDGNKNKRTRLS